MRYFRTTLFLFLLLFTSTIFAQSNVTASVDTGARTATMSNGIVSISINSKGQVSSLSHQGKSLLSNGGRFYFSYNDQSSYHELSPDNVRLEKQTDDYAEVVFSHSSGDLIVEQGYIMRKGVSGIYSYVTVKGTSTTVKLREMRVVYRVDPNQFDYGYVTDRMQGFLPSVATMKAVNSDPIMDATYQLPDGSVYTKYNWANYIVKDSVHGIMSDGQGVWAIPVSTEYMNGGPMKQELTVHTTTKTPLVLQMLQGEHFGASAQYYSSGDEKIYGPFFIYINSGANHDAMIADAKQQATIQQDQWPFQWFTNSLYPLDRSTVKGRISLPPGISPKGIQVVLAQPGSDIYEQGKNYMFWSKTDQDGNFTIKNVRQGSYTLYAYATQGDITDELSIDNATVSGANTQFGVIPWIPKKYRHLLWKIGENDRLSDGYRYSDTLRNYGLYNLPPANLNYIIGTSKPSKDWYYAQTKVGTWTITFNNDQAFTGNAVLTASIAGASNSPKVDVYLNNVKKGTWSFNSDPCIYRSAVLSGKHSVKTITFPASALVQGQNTIKLTMSNVSNRGGVMYDCLKLEAGNLITDIKNLASSNKPGFTATSYPNPFSTKTTVELNAKKAQQVSINIYNLQGQLVNKLYDGWCTVGKNRFVWSPNNQPRGTYYYQIKSDSGISTGKMVLTK